MLAWCSARIDGIATLEEREKTRDRSSSRWYGLGTGREDDRSASFPTAILTTLSAFPASCGWLGADDGSFCRLFYGLKKLENARANLWLGADFEKLERAGHVS